MSIQINYFEGVQDLSIRLYYVNITRYLYSRITNDFATVYLILCIIV